MKDIIYIFECLENAINPLTGEVFDFELLSDDSDISIAITRLALLSQPHLHLDKTCSLLPVRYSCSADVYLALKEWRLNEASIVGLPAYCIFTDEQLRNISASEIKRKSDLLFVKGIGKAKYDLYSDAVFGILKSFE